MAPASGLTPVEFPRFRGLNLGGDAQEVGALGAVDSRNVVFSPSEGRIVTRPGTRSLAGQAGYNYIVPHGVNVVLAEMFLSNPPPAMVAFSSSGVQLTSFNLSSTSSLQGYANFGTPTATTTYLAMGDTGSVVKYDGTSFSTIGSSTWNAVGVSPSDNRLAYGNTATGRSKVFFSDPGAPETFQPNNFVQLTPGDGQRVIALIPYQNQLFAFKSTKFFVFYGTDQDGSGNPIFNYRTVDTGIGLVEQNPGFIGVAVGPDGVYFVGRDGVYVTNGGPPRLVLSLTALTRQAVLPYFTGTAAYSWPLALSYYDDKLFLATANGSHAPSQTFVYDLRTQDLSLFSIKATSFAPMSSTLGLRPTLYYVEYAPTSGDLRYFDETALGNGAGGSEIFTASYRTGFWNPGQPGSEAKVREWLIDGTGTVTTKTAVDDEVTLDAGQAVTLGTAPTVAQGRDRRAVRGRNVSIEFSGQAPWSISRVIANVRGQGAPGLKSR